MKPNITEAVMAVYPNAVSVWINDEIVANDIDGNPITIDSSAVTAQIAILQAQYAEQQQAKANAKASAIAKLTALGLSAEEISALGA